ncbi:sodium:proton antiporter [Lacihabitans sp. LS3-19]|uniref:sodium:proton antiporter NhaD n=1 Tax=Lacihabitans sp. LS3-19 TaxID=2487335 RepID=UPI0020CFA03C|nr:sodium:proton antiporter NhaD [Lacihabitans sp. LS3-19]MCP9766315.1 sodium:proton antiporter [Lacihabitans sp. LS3-19]
MEGLIILIFLVGYAAIVLEHKLSINKSSSALLTGVLTWTVVALISPNIEETLHHLNEHLSEIASILFFLMGAMTIVELIATYGGFEIITSRITTTSQSRLLWIIALITFFMSALLDNLTTTIVMTTLIGKIVQDTKLKLMYVGMIVIAANSGGAWSPIGDVTTTMLWIGGQISTGSIIGQLILPSLVSLLIPLLVLSTQMKGDLPVKTSTKKSGTEGLTFGKNIIFWVGLCGLLSVPIFKSITHLPPFMGMLLALGVIWAVAEILIKDKAVEIKDKLSIFRVLEKIDLPSILFFMGILLAVGALQSVGLLTSAAEWLTTNLKNQTVVVTIIGILSSIVDNVPLVAAAMGMYGLEQFPMDDPFWELLAFCAGTGGSILIIGSAAGVAAMGIAKIEFFWYLKKISWLALIGYFSGIAVYLLQKSIFV